MISARATAPRLLPRISQLRGVQILPVPRLHPRAPTSPPVTPPYSSPPCSSGVAATLPQSPPSSLPRLLISKEQPFSVGATLPSWTTSNSRRTASILPSASTCSHNSTSQLAGKAWDPLPLSLLSIRPDSRPSQRAPTPSSPSTTLPWIRPVIPVVPVSRIRTTPNRRRRPLQLLWGPASEPLPSRPTHTPRSPPPCPSILPRTKNT